MAREAEKVAILTGLVELVTRRVGVEGITLHQRSRKDKALIRVTT